MLDFTIINPSTNLSATAQPNKIKSQNHQNVG